MWELCLGQLAEITGGRVQFSSMPPLAGHLEPIRRIVLDYDSLRPGDVFWLLSGQSRAHLHLEEVFLRGGLGVVLAGHRVAPWAGKFVLHVEDANLSLTKLFRCCPARARSKTFVFGQPPRTPGGDEALRPRDAFREPTRNQPQQISRNDMARFWDQVAAAPPGKTRLQATTAFPRSGNPI